MKAINAQNFDYTLEDILNIHFTRDELREYAAKNGIPRGRNKSDTINNLIAGNVNIFITLEPILK